MLYQTGLPFQSAVAVENLTARSPAARRDFRSNRHWQWEHLGSAMLPTAHPFASYVDYLHGQVDPVWEHNEKHGHPARPQDTPFGRWAAQWSHLDDATKEDYWRRHSGPRHPETDWVTMGKEHRAADGGVRLGRRTAPARMAAA
eukprot:g5838.t1